MNQQPMTPMQNQRPTVSKWLWILLIIVVVIAAGFFSWYFLMGPGKKTTATTTPTTTTKADKTAGWKTYSNTTYGYSFKYPTETYKLSDKTVSQNAVILQSSDTDTVLKKPLYDITVNTTKTDKTLTDLSLTWLNEINDNGTFKNTATDTTISSQKAKSVENYSDAEGAGTHSSALVIYNGYEYVITASSYFKADKNFTSTIFDSLLATFKFTTVTASADITCTNATYGFTYVRPASWGACKSKDVAVTGTTMTYYIEVATKDASFAAGDTIQDPAYYSPFAISVYTLAQWATYQADPNPTDTLIIKNGTYAFAWSQANGVPATDFGTKKNDIAGIIASFKLQ